MSKKNLLNLLRAIDSKKSLKSFIIEQKIEEKVFWDIIFDAIKDCYIEEKQNTFQLTTKGRSFLAYSPRPIILKTIEKYKRTDKLDNADIYLPSVNVNLFGDEG